MTTTTNLPAETTQFTTNDLLFLQQTHALLSLMKGKPMDKEVIADLRRNAQLWTTNLRRLWYALESRINWFAKSNPSELSLALSDNSVMIDLDTMSVKPRLDSMHENFVGSCLFRWSDKSVLEKIGIDRNKRRDIKIAPLFQQLYSTEFLSIPTNRIQHLDRFARVRIITEIVNSATDSTCDANYFSILNTVLDRIVDSRHGMLFKTSVLKKLKDRHLEMLDILLKYLDEGKTPDMEPRTWISLLYKGNDNVNNIRWGDFKKDNLTRVFKPIEEALDLSLQVVENKKSERIVKTASIHILEKPNVTGVSKIARENGLVIRGNRAVDDVDMTAVIQHRSKPAKEDLDRKVLYSFSYITDQEHTELKRIHPELEELTESSLQQFLNSKEKDFVSHNREKLKTAQEWRRTWVRYFKTGWKHDSAIYLTLSSAKAKREINFIQPHLTTLTHRYSHLPAWLIRDMLLIELEKFCDHYIDNRWSRGTWLNKFESWIDGSHQLKEDLLSLSPKERPATYSVQKSLFQDDVQTEIIPTTRITNKTSNSQEILI